jgi:hypothetical protein
MVGPIMSPPTASESRESADASIIPPPDKLGDAVEPPQKKRKHVGPMRPPQGTLAALKQAISQPMKAQRDSRLESSHSNNGKLDANSQKETSSALNPFDSKKDEWIAPADQDGSGRTSLHDKFKGRY